MLSATVGCVVTFELALRNLVSPHADTRVSVVGKSRGTLVATRLSIPTIPERVALDFIGEDSVKPGTVGGADGGLYDNVLIIIFFFTCSQLI